MHLLIRRYRILLLLLAVLPHMAGAKEGYRTILIKSDSLPLNIVSHWRYHSGDDPAWASPQYNDSSWASRASLQVSAPDKVKPDSFPGVGWFRVFLKVDSRLVKQPLALSIVNSGQADFYVDGLQIQTSASTKSVSDTLADDQLNRVPVIFILPDTAAHLLAIRFSYPPNTKLEEFERDRISFMANINTAAGAIKAQNRQTMIVSSLTIFYFSFFLAFGLIHLVLFLFYRAVLSNLWFSIFCFGLSFIFLVGFTAAASGLKRTEVLLENYGTLVIAATCAAVSAFINDLFGRGRWRYRIAQATILVGIAGIFIKALQDYVLPALILIVCIEVIVLLIRAISRKVPGARIVGSGFLFCALTIVMLFLLVLVAVGLDKGTINGVLGAVVMICIVLASVSIPVSMSAYFAWGFAMTNKNLSHQLVEVERLSGEARQHEADKQQLMQNRQEELEQVVHTRTEELRGQKEKSDELLRNILPVEIAEELKEKGSTKARMHDHVSVLFTDFADFTQMAESLSATELVAELDECFSAFDGIITSLGMEKIKTVGDAYIAVSGLPTEDARHAHKVVKAAQEILSFMQERRANSSTAFMIRLGIHSGPVVAGIVGVKKFAYDIWGDTVNTAARMEQHSEADRINISAATYELVKDEFTCTYRGELEAKHKGKMGMYFVER